MIFYLLLVDTFVSQMKAFDIPDSNGNTNTTVYTNSPAKAPNIKHNSHEVKDVCYFADRVSHILEVKKDHLRRAMQKSGNLPNIDMIIVSIAQTYLTRVVRQKKTLENTSRSVKPNLSAKERSGPQESQQVSVDLILKCGCEAVRCTRIVDFLRTLDESG